MGAVAATTIRPQMNATGAAVWCVRYPGVPGGTYIHPEGECACARGGPAPVRVHPTQQQSEPLAVAA